MVQWLKHNYSVPAFGFMDLVFSVPSLAAAAAPATPFGGIPNHRAPNH